MLLACCCQSCIASSPLERWATSQCLQHRDDTGGIISSHSRLLPERARRRGDATARCWSGLPGRFATESFRSKRLLIWTNSLCTPKALCSLCSAELVAAKLLSWPRFEVCLCWRVGSLVGDQHSGLMDRCAAAADEPEISDMMNAEDEEEIFSNDVGEENTEVRV
jgi:hypothetical protein